MTEDELATIEAMPVPVHHQCAECSALATLRCEECGSAVCAEHTDDGHGGRWVTIERNDTTARVALVAEVRRLTAELSYAGRPRYSGDASVAVEAIDAAFNRGVEAMREAAVQHFKQRAEGIEHAAARIACIAPTAAVCATLDEARRVADVADEIRALEVAP